MSKIVRKIGIIMILGISIFSFLTGCGKEVEKTESANSSGRTNKTYEVVEGPKYKLLDLCSK